MESNDLMLLNSTFSQFGDKKKSHTIGRYDNSLDVDLLHVSKDRRPMSCLKLCSRLACYYRSCSYIQLNIGNCGRHTVPAWASSDLDG